jgi:hypothetical protein
LKRDDIVLLEDGKPRDFSVFEAPNTPHRAPLELILLFDTTTILPPPVPGQKIMLWRSISRPPEPPKGQQLIIRLTAWDRDATYEFTQYWDETMSRAILSLGGADVRVSVYRFDHRQLQRLCRSTADPETFSRAIRRLPEPMSADDSITLNLAPNHEVAKAKIIEMSGTPSWVLEAELATLQDSTTAPNAMRMLAIFSEGRSATRRRIKGFGTPPQDVADQSIALGIPIYPVVLDARQYEENKTVTLARPMSGIYSLPIDMRWFADLGEMTGGRASYPRILDAETVIGVLKSLRNEGLSQYVAGFIPMPTDGRLRRHKLEVMLKSKTSGKLTGGKKTAAY